MAGRKIIFGNGEYYHIYNRGIARQPVFFSKRDYERLMFTFYYYKFSNISMKLSRFLQQSINERTRLLQQFKHQQKNVEIICFVLMPNHYHLILKQIEEDAISRFMSKTFNSYTKYINTKTERVGDLFQGVFKAVHIESNEQLLHLSRYIHLNPHSAYLIKLQKLSRYPWSTYPDYLKSVSSIVDLSPVMSHFNSPRAYEKFVIDQADYQMKLKEINHLTLE